MSYPSINRNRNDGYQQISAPKVSPQVMDMWQKLQGSIEPGVLKGTDFLSRIASGDPTAFAESEAPAMRQFDQQQSQIANRFSGRGSGGRRSSGFQNEESDASMNFAERLRGNRLNMQQGATKQLMDLYTQLMGNDPYEQFQPEEYEDDNGWDWSGAASGALSGAAAGSTFAPGWGTAAGGIAGALSGLFSKKSGYSPDWKNLLLAGNNIRDYQNQQKSLIQGSNLPKYFNEQYRY